MDDDDKSSDEMPLAKQEIQRIIEQINQNVYKQESGSKNDKYWSWNNNTLNRNVKTNRKDMRKDIGSGLFATLLTALAFEVFENSELVINLFRKNSGNHNRLGL